ncbi:hypothetical protein POL68_33310 [Stigmatella sp. ncwal1]|uniref:Uncharacterized protein n=1 Tax=Stigmatella ashevillensis TaxID=2995309 RepID=A0ABT5DJR4_9BACT|nr:hypothetical protein [Stigmatella ashevillena]MDC0713390.1 hypothetical protein [Stigmatella ashevillena]
MDVVLRPLSERFFQETVLPFLTQAMTDAPGALEALGPQVADEEVRFLCERLLASALPGGLQAVEPEPWTQLVERLVFLQWREGPSGWELGGARAGYAGDWDEALHLALMVEAPEYPYWDARAARAERDACRLKPPESLGLASMVAGLWEPFPAFPPDQVFSTQGRGGYVSTERFAFADWTWRPSPTVLQWHVNLFRKLERLLAREQARLKLPSLPERDEVLAYWAGKVPQPPPLVVSFSGLGVRATQWIRELGVITGHVREAALGRTALVSMVTQGSHARF